MKRHFLIKFLIVLLGIFSQFPLVRIHYSNSQTEFQKVKQKEFSYKVFPNYENDSFFDCECNGEFDDDGDDNHQISVSKFQITLHDIEPSSFAAVSNQCVSWSIFKIYLKNRNLRI